MAVHPFCENDEARWIGVRPGVYGENIQATLQLTNATVTIYTVPAGFTLLLFNDQVQYRSVAAAAGNGYVAICNTVPTITFYLFMVAQASVITYLSGQARFMPLVLPAGYIIRGYTSNANILLNYSYQGILIPA